MARRDITLGDRHEARQPRLGGEEIVAVGVERVVGHPIADREQLAVLVQQEAELHRQRGRARVFFHGLEARRQRRIGSGRLREVAAVALDRAAGRLRPELQVGADIVAALDRECAGDVGQGLGADRQGGEALRDILAIGRLPADIGGQRGERILEMAPGHRLHAARVAQVARLRARQLDRVGDPLQTTRVGDRMIFPFPAGIRQRDQVPGQIAAVDRGNIAGIERSQIARIVPVEEMAAEARQLAHGRQRRLQSRDRIDRPGPTEVARARGRQQIEADIGRRGPVRQHRHRIFLEVVRRQHVIERGHEGLEEPPGAARRQPQDAGVAGGHRQAPRHRR